MIAKVLGGATIVLALAAAFFLKQWVSAEAEIETVRGECNTEEVKTALASEQVAHAATVAGFEAEIENYRNILELSRRALRQAELLAQAAQEGMAERDSLITLLELEAFENEDSIPDSGACLNAFVIERSIHGLRMQAGRGDAVSIERGAAGDAIHTGTGGAVGTDTPGAHFANITYSDALKLWARDRAHLQACNGRLTAIRDLYQSQANQQ